MVQLVCLLPIEEEFFRVIQSRHGSLATTTGARIVGGYVRHTDCVESTYVPTFTYPLGEMQICLKVIDKPLEET